MYFIVNFNVFFLNKKKVNLLVSELYMQFRSIAFIRVCQKLKYIPPGNPSKKNEHE